MTPQRQAIDATAWPSIAAVPTVRFASHRAKRAEAEFAQMADRAGIELDGNDPEMTVVEETLFLRIAAHGWLGIAQSYLAGEWITRDSDALVRVLEKLIGGGYAPRTKDFPTQPDDGGELPSALLRLYTGDGVSHQAGIYSTGVPTTARQSMPSYAPGPKSHFVDVTTLSDPHAVDRDDLESAQVRAAEWMVDSGRVGAGSHVLIYPGTGAQVAVQAASRRAIVDVLSADEDKIRALDEFFLLEGVSDSIHLQLIESPVPGPKQWRGRYDAVISVDKLPILDARQRKAYVKTIDRLLAPNGRAVMHTHVATEKMNQSGRDALQSLRAYIWPGYELPTVDDVHRLVEREANLRVIAQAHVGSHASESLSQQRSFFEGHLREAAAAGFDPVYRRLWRYQFALREALLRLGMSDDLQLTIVHRNRGGKR